MAKQRTSSNNDLTIGSDFQSRRSKNPSLKDMVSENGYKVKEALTRDEEIARHVRGHLNKICPDNLEVIVERLASVQLDNADELELVIQVIFTKALDEPHYSETYTDMVHALKSRYPEFPPQNEGDKPLSFTRVLLNTCQMEFESLPLSLLPSEEDRVNMCQEEAELFAKKQKNRILANMKFIGNLFLRRLLPSSVICNIVIDLLGSQDVLPEEHMIEASCELLTAIGHTLDTSSNHMQFFIARLVSLQNCGKDDGKPTYTKRLQLKIQDLVDLQASGWKKTLYRDVAKTIDEVKKEAIQQEKMSKIKSDGQNFSTQTAGVRPAYVNETTTKKVEDTAKPNFDQNYVKKAFMYFVEERDGQAWRNDWQKAQPSRKEAKQGIDWLLEIGFSDPTRDDACAEAITELLSQKMLRWETVRDAIRPFLNRIEELRVDSPKADGFYHALLARILLVTNSSAKECLFSGLTPLPQPKPQSKGNKLSWSLLVGALRVLKQNSGPSAVRRALDWQELRSACCTAKGCTAGDLSWYFREELGFKW